MNYIEQGIKVGDKVWTIQAGETSVSHIDKSVSCSIFTDGNMASYTSEGLLFKADKSPSLFWSDPHIVSPPKPEPPKYQWLFRHKNDDTWNLTNLKYESVEEIGKAAFYLSIENYQFKRLDP